MVETLRWGSKWSFILAMIGAAVGLGNIWRYSYILYSHGGGAFFIPYLFAIFLLGIPFLILEYGMGFSFKDSFANTLKRINPKFEFFAWMLVLLVFLIVIYYVVILSWDFVYMISSFSFAWKSDTIAYFSVVGGSGNFADIGQLLLPTAAATILLWAVIWFISHRDIEKGIAKASKILIPALFVLMGFIVIYAFSLPGHMIGIDALLRPNWASLLDVNIWIAAFSQILFSLSLGQAIAFTYASYLPDSHNINDNVLFVVAANSLFEVFTAFGVFSILGFMSYNSGMHLSSLASEGTGLVFIVFPMIFNAMGIMGRILAPILFIAILFAGVTSALAVFEPMLSSFRHEFNYSRKKASAILVIIACSCSLLFTTGMGNVLVGLVDTFVNEFGILFLIGVQCIIFTWFYDVDKLIPVINEYSRFKVGKVWKIVIKYILPIIIFSMWAYGIFVLFSNSSLFNMTIYLIIIFTVIIVSFLFYRHDSGEIE